MELKRSGNTLANERVSNCSPLQGFRFETPSRECEQVTPRSACNAGAVWE